MLNYKKSVETGAEWLDQVRPGWYNLVDLTTLDISDPGRCVCGQVFREDARGSDAGDGYGWVYERYFVGFSGFGKRIADYGFAGANHLLYPHWEKEIRNRRLAEADVKADSTYILAAGGASNG